MKYLLTFIIFFTCSLFAFAQKASDKANPGSSKWSCEKVLLAPERPAVYISFLRSERIESKDRCDNPNRLFFRLTNNTCWVVWLDMSGVADPRHGDTRLYYAIEDRLGTRISGSISCHVCSINPLGPGRSIVFSLSATDASRETRMRIGYKFSWEKDMFGDYESSNTSHTVEYYFSGLSETVLPKSKVILLR